MDSGYFYLTMGAAIGAILGLYLGLVISAPQYKKDKPKKTTRKKKVPTSKHLR